MPQPQHVLDLIARHPALALIGATPLVRIDLFDSDLPAGCEIWAKAEFTNPGGSLKDRPVLRMLSDALAAQRIGNGQVILDSSSGNAGIAYAMIGAVIGVPVKLVIPGNASEERKKRILAHGASIHYTDPVEGYDEALREVRRMADGDPERYFFSDQYSNDGNWRAHYDTTAEEIIEQSGGEISAFLAGVGTGGTITGVGRRLKAHDPGIHIGCVAPEAFPGIEGLKPLDDPADIVPEIFDASVTDSSHPVSIEQAYDVCAALARRGLFVGQSSGAYLCCARELALQLNRPGRIITVLNDIGERYFSTHLWD